MFIIHYATNVFISGILFNVLYFTTMVKMRYELLTEYRVSSGRNTLCHLCIHWSLYIWYIIQCITLYSNSNNALWIVKWNGIEFLWCRWHYVLWTVIMHYDLLTDCIMQTSGDITCHKHYLYVIPWTIQNVFLRQFIMTCKNQLHCL